MSTLHFCIGSDAADARRESTVTSVSAPLGGLLSSALPIPAAGSATSVGRTVLTLRQVPIEVMASSTALLPQPSFRDRVHVTQLTLEPLVASASVNSDSELEAQSPEPVSSLSPEWPVNDLRSRSRSYSAREERLRRGLQHSNSILIVRFGNENKFILQLV